MKSVLFVSHSSRDNAIVERIARLVDENTASNCKTIVDVNDLRQGAAWSPQLYQWMAKCQAALLLLTENAIRSNWVLQEAIVLRARKVLDADFPLYVVIPDELRSRIAADGELRARWALFEPLQLDEIQGLRTFEADAIAAAVVSGLARATTAQSYLDRLSGLLEDILIAFKDQRSTLAAIAEKMTLHDAEWHRIYGGEARVVELIARRLCQGSLGEFAGLRDFLQCLKAVELNKGSLQKLLDATASYWVDLGAAACFPAVAMQASPRVLAIRSSVFQDYTGERYLARYYKPHRIEPYIYTLAGGNEAAGLEDLQQQFVAAVRDKNLAYRGFTNQKLAEHLEKLPDGVSPRFVLLPEQRVDDDAFALASRFRAFVFVVPIADSESVRARWTRCTWVQPDLPGSEEVDRFVDFGEAQQLVNAS